MKIGIKLIIKNKVTVQLLYIRVVIVISNAVLHLSECYEHKIESGGNNMEAGIIIFIVKLKEKILLKQGACVCLMNASTGVPFF